MPMPVMWYLLQAMPVVQMTPGSKVLTLAARTTDEYLHRWDLALTLTVDVPLPATYQVMLFVLEHKAHAAQHAQHMLTCS